MTKILTIDDSKMVHMVVKKALAAYNVKVITAPNGMEGFVKAQEEVPDLILLDVNMPMMDGHETLQKLKMIPETAEIPVVMLTAETSGESQEKAFETGVWMYLTKPFESEILINSLQSLIPLEPKSESVTS
ncbi:MAG: response regulator [Verrucomicrobiota bacterium]